MRGIGKRFVYVLRSDANPSRHYVGVTSNIDNRLEWHNYGPSGYTVDHRPWSVVVVIEFPTEQEAVRFERYLNPVPAARLRNATFAGGEWRAVREIRQPACVRQAIEDGNFLPCLG
jgi:putative endonuclease